MCFLLLNGVKKQISHRTFIASLSILTKKNTLWFIFKTLLDKVYTGDNPLGLISISL